jgi:hypothetical protein
MDTHDKKLHLWEACGMRNNYLRQLKQLIRKVEARGHKLHMDIFSSPNLLGDLRGKKINRWRTVRTNKGMPLDFWYKNPKLKCGDTWAKTRGDLTCVVLLSLFTVYDLWSVTPNIQCRMVAWLAINWKLCEGNNCSLIWNIPEFDWTVFEKWKTAIRTANTRAKIWIWVLQNVTEGYPTNHEVRLDIAK